MEGGGGGRRRRSLQDQMSAVDSANLRDFLRVKEEEDGRERHAGLSLEAVLAQKRLANPNRTLLDIIRTEEPNAAYKNIVGKDKRSWKTFKDKIRLKRAGAAWTSTLHVPASDIPVQNPRPQISRHQSHRFQNTPVVDSAEPTQEMEETEESTENPPIRRPQMSRRCSARITSARIPSENQAEESSENAQNAPSASGVPIQALRPQMSRHNSVRFPSTNSTNSRDHDCDSDFPTDINEDPRGGTTTTTTRRLSAALAEERQLSAREAAAAQEAAEAESAAVAAAAAEQENAENQTEPAAAAAAQPVRMSLMDLLEETDRQMGLVGSRYSMAEEEDDVEEEEEEEEDGGGVGVGAGGGTAEYNCCVCMVRHKGSAFIPCGHTFCRLCSRELWVSRGNCPLCNGFILEILDIF